MLALGVIGVAAIVIIHKEQFREYMTEKLVQLHNTVDQIIDEQIRQHSRSNATQNDTMIDQHDTDVDTDDEHTFNTAKVVNTTTKRNNVGVNDVCKLCYENAVDTVYLPCGHANTCSICNIKLQQNLNELDSVRQTQCHLPVQCSFCNQPIVTQHKIYR